MGIIIKILEKLLAEDNGLGVYRPTEYGRANDYEEQYNEDMKNAGFLGNVLGDSNVDELFKSNETNGYVPNNNDYIEKKLKKLNPYFEARNFTSHTRELFYAMCKARAVADLDPEFKPYVMPDFKFNELNELKVERFTVCYLNLYKKERDIEYLYVCLGVLEDGNQRELEPTRFFVKFKRPSQYSTFEGRNVKTTPCPHCGGPVFFKTKDTEKCTYCGQYVFFAEHNWQVYEIERIGDDTVIETMPTL